MLSARWRRAGVEGPRRDGGPFLFPCPDRGTGEMGYGEYPAGYNAKIHGPYDPARYYGKGEYWRLSGVL